MTLASLLIGCVFGLVAGLLVAGVGTAALNSRGIEVQLSGADYGRIVLGSAFAAGLWGAIGVGVGAVVRSQVPALVGLVVWHLFIENLLVGDIAGVGAVGRYLPGAAGKAISGQTATSPLSPAAAVGVLVAYATLASVWVARNRRQGFRLILAAAVLATIHFLPLGDGRCL
jgi:ABC-2 type transport system permease protein